MTDAGSTAGLLVAERLLAGLILVASLGPATVASAAEAGRAVAMILDTSGSMTGNDPQRYTVQIAQIVADLLADDDELTVIRMGGSGCFAGVSTQLALRLDPRDRSGFKAALDRLIVYDSDTVFAAPIRTAIAALGTDRRRERMLLIVADSGGLGFCGGVLTSELVELHDSGATIAAVNLGSTSGAFDHNPAFDLTTAALDAPALIEAVAQVYQRFLGAKHVQTGAVSGAIEIEIPFHVRQGFLVVAADGPIPAIEPGAGNPGAKSVDLDHRGGGATRGLDGRTRGYRIVRLEAPRPGVWQFNVPRLADRAGWLLVLDSAVGLRLVSQPTLAQGVATALEVEVFDQVTGRRITDTSSIPGLAVDFELDGRRIALRDDGQDGDRLAGDGILTGTVTIASTGSLDLPVRLKSDLLDRTARFGLEVRKATWALTVTTPSRAVVDQPVVLGLELVPLGDAGALSAPEAIDVLTGGPTIELRDDGRPPDEDAADRRYVGVWQPPVTGVFDLDYLPRGGTPTSGAKASLEVVGRLLFGKAPPIDLGRGGSGSVLEGRIELPRADVGGSHRVAISSDFSAGGSQLEIDLGRGWERLGEVPLIFELRAEGARAWPLRLRVGECPRAPAAGGAVVRLAASGPDGRPLGLDVPVAVTVIEDPWLHCWWPLLALIGAGGVVAVVAYGYLSPSRFPGHLGVVISPEEDLDEGFLHPIRGHRGPSGGFFRDDRIFVVPYRLSSRPHGAVARLRADGSRVLIEPASGSALWRRNLDDAWEQLGPEESPARPGTLYRNELENLFFALRTG